MKQATGLFKTIVNIKKSNEKVYKDEGKSLHNPFSSILSKTILKEATCSETSINISNITTLFSLLLSLLKTDDVLQNGTAYLQTLQHVCQICSKNDEKVAVRLITSGLKLFYEVKNTVDVESSLSQLFQIYANLVSYQFIVSSYFLALTTVDSHLNQVNWKFKDNVNHGESFLLLCNTVAILRKDCTESSMLSKIQLNNKILESFLHLTDNSYIKSACETLLSLIVTSHKTGNPKCPPIPEICLEPFLQMLWNTFNVLKVYKTITSNLLLCLGEIFIFTAESSTEYSVTVLKDIVPIIVQVQTEAIEITKELWATDVMDSRIESVSVLICKYTVSKSFMLTLHTLHKN